MNLKNIKAFLLSFFADPLEEQQRVTRESEQSLKASIDALDEEIDRIIETIEETKRLYQIALAESQEEDREWRRFKEKIPTINRKGVYGNKQQ